MTQRKCYQCDDNGESLAEIQARRKAEVRAWAAEQIRIADEAFTSLVGVPGEDTPFNADLGEITAQEIPDDQVVPSEEEAQAVLNDKNDTSKSDADLTADATALGAEASGDPTNVEDAKADKAPAKKAAPKK